MAVDPNFNPQDADELVEALTAEAKGALTGYWKTVRPRIEDNLKILSETSLRTAESRLKGQITDADVDAILYVQEQQLNSLLIMVQGVPYIAAQKALNAVFKVIGIVISNRTGGLLNPFP